MIEIREADPTSDVLRPIVEAHFAHSESAGPAESNHTMSAESLAEPGIRFCAIYDDQQALGCGALKLLPDGTAEVKSVHILAQARGRGLARVMMAHLADLARAEGVEALVLETGAEHLPEYDAPGDWNTDDWIGAVLQANEVMNSGADTQLDRVTRFIEFGWTTSNSILGVGS